MRSDGLYFTDWINKMGLRQPWGTATPRAHPNALRLTHAKQKKSDSSTHTNKQKLTQIKTRP